MLLPGTYSNGGSDRRTNDGDIRGCSKEERKTCTSGENADKRRADLVEEGSQKAIVTNQWRGLMPSLGSLITCETFLRGVQGA